MHEPDDVTAAWESAWNTGDSDAIAALFAADADFVNVVGLWWHDREAIRRSHGFGFTTIFPGSVIRMGQPHVRRIGAVAAVVQSRWHLAGQIAPDGTPAGPREGIFTFVLERRADAWVAVTAQNTDVAPGTQTHVNSAEGQAATYYGRVD